MISHNASTYPGEYQYLALLEELLAHGVVSDNERTGVGTLAVFGRHMRFNLADGFPLLTTKKLYFKGITHELLWFLRGDTNIKYLQENNVHIWDEWADKNGDIGPAYGHQWRSFEGPAGRMVDQIAKLAESLKHNPASRRHIVTAWNPTQVDQMALPPCHLLFQFNVFGDKLSCMMVMRSVDTLLGMPFNIASYAMLTMMLAQVSGYKPGELICTFGNTHLYKNHIEQARLQCRRIPRAFPTLHLNPNVTDIFEFKYKDFTLEGYDPWPAIAAPIAV